MLLAALCPFFRAAGQVNHTTMPSGITVIGKVTDDQGIPLPGATVKVKNTVSAVVSANDGTFIIKAAPLNGLLVISFISYQQVEIPITASMREPLLIQLKSSIGSLDEVQIIGYGTSTKRFNTGSVSTISAKEIEDQPVTNVLSALSGRMPGVLVQTTNGLPGGNVNIQIRGKGSITAGTNPLYIIDGVPFATTVGTLSGGTSLLGTSSINGAISPFNSINPEKVSVF
jgi:outer membrane receptor protein involved in Fe transport